MTRQRETMAGFGVVDTGCTRFLIGDETVKEWRDLLATQQLDIKVEKAEREQKFRFGNDRTEVTDRVAIIPGGISGINGIIRADVIPGRVPLLISKGLLRTMGRCWASLRADPQRAGR